MRLTSQNYIINFRILTETAHGHLFQNLLEKHCGDGEILLPILLQRSTKDGIADIASFEAG